MRKNIHKYRISGGGIKVGESMEKNGEISHLDPTSKEFMALPVSIQLGALRRRQALEQSIKDVENLLIG